MFGKKKEIEVPIRTAVPAEPAVEAPKAEEPVKEKLVPLPAPFLGSWPGVVGEEAARLVSHAPKAGDKMEGSATFGKEKVDYKIDCLG